MICHVLGTLETFPILSGLASFKDKLINQSSWASEFRPLVFVIRTKRSIYELVNWSPQIYNCIVSALLPGTYWCIWLGNDNLMMVFVDHHSMIEPFILMQYCLSHSELLFCGDSTSAAHRYSQPSHQKNCIAIINICNKIYFIVSSKLYYLNKGAYSVAKLRIAAIVYEFEL